MYTRIYFNLGKMNDEQLIVLVRQYSVLYDISHPKYMDSMFKVGIWRKIASNLNESVTACKARWNNIRDNYRKSLKKTSNGSGKGKAIKLYKYSEQLSFLKKFFYEREAKGNHESQEEEQNKQEYERPDRNEENEDYGDQVQTTKEESEGNISDANEDSQSQASSNSNCKMTCVTRRLPIARKAPAKKLVPRRTASSKLIEFLISKNQPETTRHPVDAFLAGVAPTLKALPPYYLSLAKSEVFAVVHKYELKMIMEQHSYQERINQSSNSSLLSVPVLLPTEAFSQQEHTTPVFQCPQPQQSQILSPIIAVPNTSANSTLQS